MLHLLMAKRGAGYLTYYIGKPLWLRQLMPFQREASGSGDQSLCCDGRGLSSFADQFDDCRREKRQRKDSADVLVGDTISPRDIGQRPALYEISKPASGSRNHFHQRHVGVRGPCSPIAHNEPGLSASPTRLYWNSPRNHGPR